MAALHNSYELTLCAFSWKALQSELSNSPYLMPDDDIKTQRGLIATASAILERMANSVEMREVSWKPVRLSKDTVIDPLKPVIVSSKSNGISLVENPKPLYLLPEDDILSQRGIIATAQAILERMTNSENMREVTWKPVRLSMRSNEVTVSPL